MKKVILAIMLLCTPLMAAADLNIFACEPEWAALADELGGDKVKTNCAPLHTIRSARRTCEIRLGRAWT